MKRLLTARAYYRRPCVLLALGLVFFCTAVPLQVLAATPGSQIRKPAAEQVTATYLNATLTEDTSWRGTVVVKGFVTIAAQTTLRIEPGTVIRFLPLKGSRQLPRLVVMGRIQSIGTADRPILFAPNQVNSSRGDWGGILLLSSEKRNQFEHCRIEGAETGLEGRFSTVTAKSLSVTRSTTGCLLRDSTATLAAPNFTACDTGLEAHDSEVEVRDAQLVANRLGLGLFRSAVVMSSSTVSGSSQQGILSVDCRLKFNSCEISDNVGGAQISGGEGQIFLSRFVRNRETALHLSAARVRLSRCQISGNIRVGLRLDDDRATVWGNAISDNGGYNLLYSGRDSVNVMQNWWGSSDEASILAKLSVPGDAPRSGVMNIYPWLTEKPAIFP